VRAIVSLLLLIIFGAGRTTAGITVPARQNPTERVVQKPLPVFLKTQAWIQLAKAHHVGEVDDPVRTLAQWPANDLQLVDHDINTIHLVINAAALDKPGWNDAGGRGIALRDLPALLDLPLDTFDREGLNIEPHDIVRPNSRPMAAIAKVMVQIAMLQTDLALAAFDDSTLQTARLPSRATIRVADADRTRAADLTLFWDAAREAMDIAEPTPWGGPLAHDWYVSTTEYMLGRRDYSAGLAHAEHARLTLPGNARLAVFLGGRRVIQKKPAIQLAFQQGEITAIGSRPDLLTKAEFQYRSAMLLDPDRPVVSLRLGRTLQLKGRNAEALPFLARAETGVGLPEWQYCAALFSGLAYQALDREGDARAAFQRASTMFPDAQTPRLALAQMTLRTSGQEDALVHLRSMAATLGAKRGNDPWWVYDIAVAPAGAERIDTMRTAVREALR